MKGFIKNGKFRPIQRKKSSLSSLIVLKEPSNNSLSEIRNKYAPDGIFKHKNPRTNKIEEIRLKKINVLNNGKNHHILVGNGSDGRPVTKIVK